ncbi:hypothetical protein B0H13DRAFT_1868043 [Mycena leptocephala]|nr:hypothetical protein B0H13DRAFT_1868043 [Mycena leptocephala]
MNFGSFEALIPIREVTVPQLRFYRWGGISALSAVTQNASHGLPSQAKWMEITATARAIRFHGTECKLNFKHILCTGKACILSGGTEYKLNFKHIVWHFELVLRAIIGQVTGQSVGGILKHVKGLHFERHGANCQELSQQTRISQSFGISDPVWDLKLLEVHDSLLHEDQGYPGQSVSPSASFGLRPWAPNGAVLLSSLARSSSEGDLLVSPIFDVSTASAGFENSKMNAILDISAVPVSSSPSLLNREPTMLNTRLSCEWKWNPDTQEMLDAGGTSWAENTPSLMEIITPHGEYGSEPLAPPPQQPHSPCIHSPGSTGWLQNHLRLV